MSIELVGIDSLPNVYIEKVKIYENDLQTTIVCDVVAFDYKQETQSVWYQHRLFKNYMNINMCFVNDSNSIDSSESVIRQINEGNVLMPSKVLRKTKASMEMSVLPFINNQKKINQHFSVSEYHDNQKNQYRYSIMISTNEKLLNTSAVYAYFSLDVEAIEKQYNIDLSYDNNKSINGPISCEILKSNNSMQGTSTIYVIENTQQIWTGPVHRHTNDMGETVFMAGESHSDDISHPNVMPVDVENSKILYYSRLNLKGMRNKLFETRDVENLNLKTKMNFMNKRYGFPYSHEMNSSFDDDGNLHKIFIIDLCNMALMRSYAAKKIFDNNLELFMEIGRTLSLDYLSVTRTKKRSLYERQIISYNNDDRDVIPETNFYLSKDGELFTFEDNNKYKKIGFLKQMQAGLPEQQMALYFVDHEADYIKSGTYAYRILLEIKDKFYNYVETVIKDLHEGLSLISSLHEDFTVGKQFDFNSNMAKIDFLVSYFSNFDIDIDSSTGSIIENANTEGQLSNSPFLRVIDYIEEAFDLINYEIDVGNFINKINPITATPESLEMAIKDIRRIISLLEKGFRIKPRGLRSSESTAMGSRSPQRKNVIVMEKSLKSEKIINDVDVGYKFINFNKKQKMFRLQKRDLMARANYEVGKYFSGPPTNTSFIKNINSSVRASVGDIDSNKMMYFTPHKIKVGNQVVDTEYASNNKKFQTLMITREVRSIAKNPQLALNLSLLNMEEEGVDHIDSLDMLGADSPFVKQISRLVKNRKYSTLEKSKDLDDIAAVVFSTMRTVKSRRKSFGLRAFDPEHEECTIIEKLRTGALQGRSIPVQIKSLMLSKTPTAKNNYVKNDNDIFDNHETNEIARQKFTNIKKLNYLEGFSKMKNGLFNLSKPIYKDMSGDNYNSIAGVTKICKMDSYNETALNIIEEEDDFNTLGSFFVLEDTGYQEPKTFAMRRKRKTKVNSRKIINSAKNSQKLFSSSIKVRQNKKALGMLGAVAKRRKRKVIGIEPKTTSGLIPTESLIKFDSKQAIKEIKIDGLYPVGAEENRESEQVKTKNTGPTKEEQEQMKKKKTAAKKKTKALKDSRNALRDRSSNRRNKTSPSTTTRGSGGMTGGSSGGSSGGGY